MAYSDHYADAADALKIIIDATYAAEQVVATHDQLHEALGVDGAVCGISPLREAPIPTQRTTQQTYIQIQFFDTWEKEIDPNQEVDPRIITRLHARLLESLRVATVAIEGVPWYFQWEGTDYPRDPTGNNTRFVMTLRAWSNNAAEYETVA
jgi:hypothetical protein